MISRLGAGGACGAPSLSFQVVVVIGTGLHFTELLDSVPTRIAVPKAHS